MPRPDPPDMHDPEDKELRTREGVAPYPIPERARVASRDEGDIEDPASAEGDAPHDRGKMRGRNYTTGVDAMKKKLERDGALENWKDGRTQGAPRR